MADSVRFPPNIGGSGKTYTNDANPETGMFNGGHRKNFFPLAADVAAAARYVGKYAQAIDGAKGSADRAEDARGYVEAVADGVRENILAAAISSATYVADHINGVYKYDNGDVVRGAFFDIPVYYVRSTPKRVLGPSGQYREVAIDAPARRWINGQCAGIELSDGKTNQIQYARDWARNPSIGLTFPDSDAISPFGTPYIRMVSVGDGASRIRFPAREVSSRMTAQLWVSNDFTSSNILLTTGEDFRVNISLNGRRLNTQSSNANASVSFEDYPGGMSVTVNFSLTEEVGSGAKSFHIGLAGTSTSTSINVSSPEGAYVEIATVQFVDGDSGAPPFLNSGTYETIAADVYAADFPARCIEGTILVELSDVHLGGGVFIESGGAGDPKFGFEAGGSQFRCGERSGSIVSGSSINRRFKNLLAVAFKIELGRINLLYVVNGDAIRSRDYSVSELTDLKSGFSLRFRGAISGSGYTSRRNNMTVGRVVFWPTAKSASELEVLTA